jgi:hypothetical protein
VSVYLRLNQDQVNEEHYEIVLDIFVGEPLAPRALRQTHALAERTVICLAVCRIEMRDWIATFNAYWHGASLWIEGPVSIADEYRSLGSLKRKRGLADVKVVVRASTAAKRPKRDAATEYKTHQYKEAEPIAENEIGIYINKYLTPLICKMQGQYVC